LAAQGQARLKPISHSSIEETTMNGHKNLNGLIGAEESTRLMGQLQRGASRRDVLAMLMAGGMQATYGAAPPQGHYNDAVAVRRKRGTS
jgi:hypothetical protein